MKVYKPEPPDELPNVSAPIPYRYAVDFQKKEIELVQESLDLIKQSRELRREYTGLSEELLDVYRSNYTFVLQLILDTPEENLDRLKVVAKDLLERMENE